MAAAVGQALDTALALLDSPGRLASCRTQPLPDDILPLIRIAAGDAEVRRDASQASRRPEEKVTEAAVFYIQQVLFHQSSDSYRTLGVGDDWTSERIKEHYRWLVRWLHPDRNDDEWDALYADRVTRAWNDLRTPERRREYDQNRAATPAPVVDVVPVTAGYRPSSTDYRYVEPSRLSARTRQRMPLLIFGGLSLVAVLGLTILYLGQQPAVGEEGVVAIADEPAVVAEPAAVGNPASGAWPKSESVARAVSPAPAVDVANHAPVPPTTPPPKPAPAATPVLVKTTAATSVPMVAKAATTPATVLPAKAPAPERTVASAANPPVAPTQPASPRETRAAARNVAVEKVARTIKTGAPAALPPAPAAPPVAVVSAPVAPSPPVAPPTVVAASLDLATVNELLRRFRGAFASGDLGRMQPLLTQHAGTLSRDRVLQRYQRLFADSANRRLEIRDPSWQSGDNHAVILAAVDSWWMPTGSDDTEHARGKLRLDLAWEDGQWRILDLHHDETGR